MKRGSGKSPKSRVRSCFFQLDCEKSDFEHCQVVSSWGGRFDGQWSRSPTFVVRFSLDVSSYWRVVLLCTIRYSHTHAAGYVCLYHVNHLHQSRVNQTDVKRIEKKGKLPSHCLQKNLFGLVFKHFFLVNLQISSGFQSLPVWRRRDAVVGHLQSFLYFCLSPGSSLEGQGGEAVEAVGRMEGYI